MNVGKLNIQAWPIGVLEWIGGRVELRREYNYAHKILEHFIRSYQNHKSSDEVTATELLIVQISN